MEDITNSPSALALLMCDTVITDAATGKKTLVGVFNSMKVGRLPHVIPQFFVFASITNVRGEIPVNVRLTSVAGDEIFNLSGKVKCSNELASPEMIFHIQNLPMKTTGLFSLELFSGSNFLASRTFSVDLINKNA